MQLVKAMEEKYDSLCKSSDAGVTQANGLAVSGAVFMAPLDMAPLENFVREIISKTALEELAKDKRWQESIDSPVRGVIERFFSDLADVWNHTPTGAWAEVGLRQRQEKIRGCLSSLLEVYGVDADAQDQKHQQVIAGAVRLIDYVGMTGAAVPSASAAQVSGYNARIIEAERGHTGLFLNKLGFSTCPKKEAAVKALLTDKAAQYPVTGLPAGSEQVFCRGAEAVELIIANTRGLTLLQQFSHLTDSQDRTRVQYHNIKALLACWPDIENNQDARKAVTLMLGAIIEDMLIESTATISIEGEQKSSRAVCAEMAKASQSGLYLDLDEAAIYTQILVWAKNDKQGPAKGKETSLSEVTRYQDAHWWQICKQKIFTPHAATQALLERQSGVSADQSSTHKLLSSFLSTIERIRPVEVPPDACWFTMAGMMAIVEMAAKYTAQPVIRDEGSYKILKRQQASTLLQLCANNYLIPVYVQRSRVSYEELFASIESIKQSVEGQSQVEDFQKLNRVIVYEDLFEGQDGFQEAYHPYKDSITSHTGTYEQVSENIKTNILGAPEKGDAVLQAVGEIIKTTNKWSSAREAQVQAEQAADAMVSAGFTGQRSGDSSAAHIRDEISSSTSPYGLLSSSVQAAPSVGAPVSTSLDRGKSIDRQVVPPRVPVVEKILMQDQAGATMPAVKVLYTNTDKCNRIKGLESVLQQAYSKKIWDRWGEANRLSIPNLAAGASCLTCLAMACWSWMTGDIIGLTLNIITVVLVSWYTKKAYQNAVTELQKIPSTCLSRLSEQGVITGQLDHKNWAWNKSAQQQPKGGFSVRSLLGYGALLTPGVLVAVLILKAKGWISLGILGLKSLTGLAGVAPVQATQFTKHIGQVGKALGSSNLVEKVGSSLAPR